MSIQRTIWLGAIVTAISAAVSVATVCVVVPRVVVKKPAPAEPTDTDPFAGQADPQQPVLAAEEDQEAIAAIKKGLDIDLFSGTVLDGAGGAVFDEFQESSAEDSATTDDSTAERDASVALSAVAEQLRSEGKQRAADLVQAAAKKLQDSTVRRASADQSTKSR